MASAEPALYHWCDGEVRAVGLLSVGRCRDRLVAIADAPRFIAWHARASARDDESSETLTCRYTQVAFGDVAELAYALG